MHINKFYCLRLFVAVYKLCNRNMFMGIIHGQSFILIGTTNLKQCPISE